MDKKEKIRIMKQGENADKAGLTIRWNPYERGTAQHYFWDLGYLGRRLDD